MHSYSCLNVISHVLVWFVLSSSFVPSPFVSWMFLYILYCYPFYSTQSVKKSYFWYHQQTLGGKQSLNHGVLSYVTSHLFLQWFGCSSVKLLFTFWYRFMLWHSNIGNLLWIISILNVHIRMDSVLCHSKYIVICAFLSFLIVLLGISNIVVIVHIHLFFSLNSLGLDWHI